MSGETISLPTTLRMIIDRAARFGLGARRWERHGKLRIYAPTSGDVSVWLEIKGSEDDVKDASFEARYCGPDGVIMPRNGSFRLAKCEERKNNCIALWHAFVLEHYAKATDPTPWQRKHLDDAMAWMKGRN